MTGPDQEELMRIKKVYEVVRDNPGLDYRDLQARVRLNMQDLRSGINYLRENDLIVREEYEDNYRYYMAEGISDAEKNIMSYLRQYILREIIFYLIQHPNSKASEIRSEIHLSSDTMSRHLKKLRDAGVIAESRQGWASTYRVNDPEKIKKLLVQYKESFLDRLVNRFIESWAGK